MRNKKLIIALILTFTLVLIAAVGCVSTVGAFELKETTYWLDRYDEADIELVSGNMNELTFTSADEKIVTVSGGRLIAQGKGETTVTVSNKKQSASIAVKVRESGVKPTLDLTKFNVYENYDSTIPGIISYNGKKYERELEYTAEIADTTVATFANNKIKGLKLGATSAVKLTATYKGLTLTKNATLEVKPQLYINMQSEIELYNVETKAGEFTLDAKAIKIGKEIDGANISYSIVNGDEQISIDGGVVKAVSEGTAKIQASYTGEASNNVTLDINVKVNPNYVETYFDLPDNNHGVTWADYTGAAIGGRTDGIKSYNAGAGADGNTGFDRRVVEANVGKGITDLYRLGYRYFTYDLFYTSNQNQLLGCHSTTTWVSVGEVFMRDYVKIVCDGVETNCFDKNKWITVVYDLKALWEIDMGMQANFFFFVKEATTTSYISNVRYYLDDKFMQERPLTYEDKGDYVQGSEDEFIIGSPVSSSYPEAGGNPGNRVKPEQVPLYGKFDGAIGGREGVYKYETKISDRNKNALLLASSLGDFYADGMYNIKKKGAYFSFDIFPAQDSTYYLQLNTDVKVKITPSTVLQEFKGWLSVFKQGDEKKQNFIVKNVWQTVVIDLEHNYSETAWRANMSLSSSNSGDITYIDNVRFYNNGDFIPTQFEEYSGEIEKSPFVAKDKYGNVFVDKYVGDDETLKGSYEYVNGTIGSEDSKDPNDDWNRNWGDSGFMFEGVRNAPLDNSFFTQGNKWIKTDIYIKQANSLSIRVSIDYVGDYWQQEIPFGKKFNAANIYVVNAAGERTSFIDKGNWYTLYIPVEYTAVIDTTDVCVYTNGGSAENPSVMYLKNVEFLKEVSLPDIELDPIYVGTTYPNHVSVDRQTDGSWKYVNKTGGATNPPEQNWGESGVFFNAVGKNGNKYIKTGIKFAENVASFSLRFSSDLNNGYCVNLVEIDSKLPVGRELNFYNEANEKVDSISRNTWYTLYIPIYDVGALNSLYSNGGNVEKPAVIYFRDIGGVKEVSQQHATSYPYSGGGAEDGAVEKVTADGEFKNTWKYTNSTDANGGKNGKIHFSGVRHSAVNNGQEMEGVFFDGYDYLNMDIYFGANATAYTIYMAGSAGTLNVTLSIGSAIPEGLVVKNASGEVVQAVTADAWYTIELRVEYNKQSAGWTEFAAYSVGGTASAPAIMYIDNINFTKLNAVA